MQSVRKIIWSILLTGFIFLLLVNIAPGSGFAQADKTVTGSIVQIEKNLFYSIPLGTQHGAKKGDVAEIFRDGTKIAEIRLISVFVNTSIGVTISGDAEILATDIARLSGPKLSYSKEQAQAEEKELLSQRQNWREKLSSLNNELKELKTQIKDKDAVIAALDKERAELNKSLDQSQRRLSGMHDELLDLEEKLDAIRASRNKELKIVKEPLQEKISKLNSELELLKKTSQDELKKAEGATAARISSLGTQLKDKNAAVAVLDKENTELSKSLEQRDKNLSSMQKEFLKLKEKLKAARASRAKEIKTAREPLQEKISLLEDELKEIKDNTATQVSSLQDLLEGKSSLIVSMDRENVELAKSLKQKDKELFALQGELSRQRTEFEENLKSIRTSRAKEFEAAGRPLREKIATLNSELASLKKTSQDELKKAEGATAARISSLEAQLEDKNSLIVSLNKDKADLNNSLEQRNQNLINLQKDISELEKNLKSIRTSRAKELKSAKQPLREKIARLNSELELLKKTSQDELKKAEDATAARISSLRVQVKDKDSAISSLNKEKATLDKSLKQRDKVLFKLQEELSQLKAKLAYAQTSRTKDVESLKQPLQAKIIRLNSELTLLRKNSQDELSRLQRQYKIQLNKQNQQWQKKLTDLKEGYQEKLAQQVKAKEEELLGKRQDWQEELSLLKDELETVKNNSATQVSFLKAQLEDKDSVIAALDDEKNGLDKSLDEKEKTLISLRDEAGRTKADAYRLSTRLNDQKGLIASLKTKLDQKDNKIARLEETISYLREGRKLVKAPSVEERPKVTRKALERAIEARQPDDGKEELERYYSKIRETILNNFRRIDLANYGYEDMIDSITVEFWLSSDGYLKGRPKFHGATDEAMEDVLYQHFKKAFPFPAFPESLRKDSVLFTIEVIFKGDRYTSGRRG